MRIALKDIVVLFQNMQEELNISYVSIVIFVAVDVDSICTLKIFSKMFKCENIQYKVYPVTTYTQLQDRIEESKAYNKVKMFMFINCGGSIDLTECWFVEQKQAQVFLFDIHKPIHHKNIECSEIKIVDDALSQYENCPTSEQVEKYEQLNDYELDSDEDDDSEEDIDEKVEGSPKRSKKRQFKEKLRKHKKVIENKIANYYGKNFFGYPNSYSAYLMIKDLEKASNDYLWYAIVGTTSMYLQQKITRQTLDTITEVLRGEVNRFNVGGSKREKGDISTRKGYQFTLLDHWSLYESMLYSNYLMIKLHLWDQKGLNKLNEFIHYLEISLINAKQLFKFMPRQAQQKLENNIAPIAQKFLIHDVVFPSFVKQLDYVDSAMASDYFHILTSVLEAPPKSQLSFQQMNQHRIKCFWQAYDILDGNMKQLQPKIQDYKRTIRILMNQTKNIIERDHLIMTKTISIANIRNDTDDKKIFAHPSTLIRLAYMLMGILRERKKSKKNSPFVANWIDLEKEICMVVGVMMDNKNTIGNKFNEIAEKLNIQVNHDNFMANIIVIKRQNLSEFIKQIGM